MKTFYIFEKNQFKIFSEELHLNKHSFFPTKLKDNEKLTVRGAVFEKKTLFYPSKKYQGFSYYKNDSLHGPSLYFSEEGILLSECCFFEGKKEGYHYLYYPSKALYSIQKFKNGKREKEQKYFYEEGDLRTFLEYKNGLCHGKMILFYEKGKIKREAFFFNGKKVKSEKIFDENGNLFLEKNYE